MKDIRENQNTSRNAGLPSQRGFYHSSAKVRAKRQVTVPEEVAAALGVEEGDQLEFDVDEAGEVVVRGTTTIPADQRWFWQADWQAGEREASEQIDSGTTATYDDVEAMFDDLER